MESRFNEMASHLVHLREGQERLEQGHQSASARLGLLETTSASLRMRLETVEARIPLLTQSEGRLLGKAVGIVTAVVSTFWGVWWALTQLGVVLSSGLGLVPKK